MMAVLYKKKVIRDFLSLYSESHWTQLISHISEYGIILFKKKYTISALSPDDVYHIVENFKKNEGIYDTKIIKKGSNLNENKRKSSDSQTKKILNTSTGSKRSGSFNSKGKTGKGGIVKRVNSNTNNIIKQNCNLLSKNNSSNNNVLSSRKAETPSRKNVSDGFKFNNKKVPNRTQTEKENTWSKQKMSNSIINNQLNTTTTSNVNNISVWSNISNNNKNDSNGSNLHISTAIKGAIKTKAQMPVNTSTKGFSKIKEQSGSNTININPFNNSNKSVNDNTNDSKQVNYNKEKASVKPPSKAESKIKALIEQDKKKHQQQKYSNIAGTWSFSPTQSSALLTNTKLNNLPDNLEETKDSKIEVHAIKNETSIISWEDKWNGLTMKLSKLNASITTNKQIIDSNQKGYPHSINQLKLDDIEDDDDNWNAQYSLMNKMKLQNTDTNKDEDYWALEEIDLDQECGVKQGSNVRKITMNQLTMTLGSKAQTANNKYNSHSDDSDDNETQEMRCYRKTEEDD